MNSMDKKNIVFNIDQNYLYPLLVAIDSIQDNNNLSDFKITILSVDLSLESKKIIKKLFDTEVEVVEIGHLIPNNLPKNMFYTKTVYAKMFLERVFSCNGKFLYLDPDIIVKDDLNYLFNIDLLDYPLAAVQSPTSPEFGAFYGVPYWREIGAHPRTKYLNSGVMLIDYKKWTDLNIIDKSFEHNKKFFTKIKIADQDFINVIINGNFLNLPTRWNQETPMRIASMGHQGYMVRSYEEIEEAVKNPAIVHFTGAMEGRSKPWLKNNLDPLESEWLHRRSLIKSRIKNIIQMV